MTTLLLTAVGAATEGQDITAAAVEARATLSAVLGGSQASVEADARASVPTPQEAPAPPPLPSRPAPERPPPPPPSDQTNETNKTSGSPPEPAPANATRPAPEAPATLAPAEQHVHGQAGAPIRFVVMLTNAADVAQDVALATSAPAGWDVRVSPGRALLGPHETVEVRGMVVTPRMVGATGTIELRAIGEAGDAFARVIVCSVGHDGQCERPPRPLDARAPERSHPDRANGTEPSREPAPANETAPPSNGTAPPSNHTAPPSNGTAPPSNKTAPPPNGTAPPSNGTAGGPPASPGGNATSGSGQPSAGAHARITIEAGRTGTDGADEEAEDEAVPPAEDDEDASPPPVTLDV